MRQATTMSAPLDVRLMEGTAQALFLLAALLVLLLLLNWAARLPVFTLQGIRLDSEPVRTNVPTLRANALPRLSGNLFTIDLAQARNAFESAPWVRRAVVRRMWPDRLHVTLEEHEPAAYWRDAGADQRDQRLINTYGEVFEANLGDVEDEDMPALSGPRADSRQVLQVYQQMAGEFSPLALQLDELRLSERGSWQVLLQGGARVELGRGEPSEVITRVQTFVDTLPQVLARFERPLVSADLRHRGAYAVQLQGITTLEPQAGEPARRR